MSYETTEGRVHTVTGGDWDEVRGAAEGSKERVVVNMGPQHPSTHGVLRMILELEGETVKEARAAIGYLHTGIEKNMEYRTFSQGPTFVTRMDYLTSFFNEAAYVMSVERLLGIEIPERAKVIRVMMMELNRVNSHLVCLGTGGMELGALTAMTNGFRDRELLLDLFEGITGLRMNHAYFRPGGVANDLPDGIEFKIAETITQLRKNFRDNAAMLSAVNAYRATLNLGAIPASQIDNTVFYRLDMRASKAINLGGGRKVELIGQVFNLLGQNNLGGVGSSYQTNVRAATFGRILSAQPKQQGEVAIRFTF